jgi:hypothetical protein
MAVAGELVDRKEQVLQEMLAGEDSKEIKERQQALVAQQVSLACQAQQPHLQWREMVEVALGPDFPLLMHQRMAEAVAGLRH